MLLYIMALNKPVQPLTKPAGFALLSLSQANATAVEGPMLSKHSLLAAYVESLKVCAATVLPGI